MPESDQTMNTDIKQTFRRLWEAACMDAPLRPSVRVHNGYFVLTITGNEAQWETLTKAAGAPDNAERQRRARPSPSPSPTPTASPTAGI